MVNSEAVNSDSEWLPWGEGGLPRDKLADLVVLLQTVNHGLVSLRVLRMKCHYITTSRYLLGLLCKVVSVLRGQKSYSNAQTGFL